MEDNVRKITRDDVIEDVPEDLFSTSKPLDVADLLFTTSSPTTKPLSPLLTSNPSITSGGIETTTSQQQLKNYSEFDLGNIGGIPPERDSSQQELEEDVDIQLGGDNVPSDVADPFATTQSLLAPPLSASSDAQMISTPSSRRVFRSDSNASSIQPDVIVSSMGQGLSPATPLMSTTTNTSTTSSNNTKTATLIPSSDPIHEHKPSPHDNVSVSTSFASTPEFDSFAKPPVQSPLAPPSPPSKIPMNIIENRGPTSDTSPAPPITSTASTIPPHETQLPVSSNPLPPPPVKPNAISTISTSKSTASLTSPRMNPLPPALDPIFFGLPTRKWTDPTTFFDVQYNDPLVDVIQKNFTPSAPDRPARKLLSVEEALTHEDPFLVLMKASSWRSLAILARHDIVGTHPQEVDKIMRLWAIRWYALLRLRQFQVIEYEIEKLGDFDAPEMMFEKHQDIWPGRKGHIVSLDVRLLVCQLPALKSGNHFESIHKLYKILYNYGKGYSNGTVNADTWGKAQARIMGLVSTLLVASGDLISGVSIVKQATVLNPSSVDLQSLLGRMYLQLGDVASARYVFASVENMLGVQPSLPRTSTDDIRLECDPSKLPTSSSRPDLFLSNRAFLLFAEGHYDLAVQHLTELVNRAPAFVCGINNLSIAQLYMGNVSQASNFLESIAIDLPSKAGASTDVLFNLCTMYDLTDHSLEKKKRLLSQVVAKSTGDDFRPECLKLS